MLGFIKKLFGAKPAAPAPYKVETPTPVVVDPVPTAKKPAKKPAVKKATTRKPRAPKA